MHQQPAYKRILLKLSGEALLGSQKFGVDPEACCHLANAIHEIVRLGVQVGLVIGGGNIFRGGGSKMDRVSADQVGMLATIMNAISLREALVGVGCEAQVLSAVECIGIVEGYTRKKAVEILQRGAVAIFAGGTGNPYFTTDSAAALRALEIGADILFKATKVDGVYDKDPVKHPEAMKFDRISYSEILTRRLQVMDATAIALCRENRIPIRVFNIFGKNELFAAVCNQATGTFVEGT